MSENAYKKLKRYQTANRLFSRLGNFIYYNSGFDGKTKQAFMADLEKLYKMASLPDEFDPQKDSL